VAPDAYFAQARAAFKSVAIPPPLQRPSTSQRTSVEQLGDAFMRANPGLGASSFVITCSNGDLTEVRVCLDRNLQPRACTRQVQGPACRSKTIDIQPMRRVRMA
jgi:ribonuclease T2